MVLFADDTSLLITDSNDLDININQSFRNIIYWFNRYLLIMNFNKTHNMESGKQLNISNSTETKFWGLIINKTLSWNQHIDQIATKLCSACYALRNMKHIVPHSTLRKIYYAYIHSILSYVIIFWGEIFQCSKIIYFTKENCQNHNQHWSKGILQRSF